jgi:hypothetical protein
MYFNVQSKTQVKQFITSKEKKVKQIIVGIVIQLSKTHDIHVE